MNIKYNPKKRLTNVHILELKVCFFLKPSIGNPRSKQRSKIKAHGLFWWKTSFDVKTIALCQSFASTFLFAEILVNGI